MKKNIAFIIVAALAFISCGKQLKPKDPPLPANSLAFGVNLVTLKIKIDEQETERRFKYFLPTNIDTKKPISLIFEFHGSYPKNQDPMNDVSTTSTISRLASQENCIAVFPAGVESFETINWLESEKHLPFVDSMIAYFKKATPAIDINRVYTTGHSSGAIFSFELALKRSEVFAAAVPVSGQRALKDGKYQKPLRVVPIRAFNGTNDDAVQYKAALNNIGVWAEKIAGYKASDATVSEEKSIPRYKKYTIKKWTGGSADIEFFSIMDEGHGIDWDQILPLMWEFMRDHPKKNSHH